MSEETTKKPFDPTPHLIRVQGNRPYLPVAARIQWFREEKPDWGIETEALNIDGFRYAADGSVHRVGPDGQYAIFRAKVYNADGMLMATGTKREDVRGFPDYTEKSESGSIGRALALCGFGTQFCPDLEESERLADSPRGGRSEQQQRGPHGGGNQQRTQGQPQGNRQPDRTQQPAPPQRAPTTAAVTKPSDHTLTDEEADDRIQIGKDCGALIKKLPEQLRPEVAGMILERYNREFHNLTMEQLRDLKSRVTHMAKRIKPALGLEQNIKECRLYMTMAHPELDPQVCGEVERIWGRGPEARLALSEWLLDTFNVKSSVDMKPDFLAHVLTTLSHLPDAKSTGPSAAPLAGKI